MARRERLAVATDQVGVLVLLQPDAVAGAVDEVRTVAAVVDEASGDGVDVLARRAHRGGVDRGGLRGLEHGVEIAVLRRWRSGEHRARDVGAVAVEGAAEVAHDRLTRGDDAPAGAVVRAGRVGPAPHDGEVHALMTLGHEPAPDVARHIGLGTTDERDVARNELRGDAIGGRGGSP